jgi:enoyl-CoA hydratase/carnithine racemase
MNKDGVVDQASLTTQRVTVSIDDGVASVRLNRADKLNALDVPMLAALADTGEQLKQDSSVRVVVLSGEGRGFCAGLDVGSLQAMSGGDVDSQPSDGVLQQIGETGGRITHLAQQAAYVWQELESPVIAAVHGVVLGGGCQIALCADMRIASPDARFSVLEIRWGLVPDMTGTAMLPLLVGLDVAKELSFTGRMVSAEEAARIGLVTRVSDSPLDDALALAQEIARKSPQAIRGVKKLLNRARYASLAEQFRDERETIKPLLGSRNQVEAVMAHLEKRDPVFED